MGNELVSDQAYVEAGDVAIPPDDPFANMDHGELLYKFCKTNGDPDVGRALMMRVLDHTHGSDGIVAAPAIEDDRTPAQEGKISSSLLNYLGYATSHHPEHLGSILDFIDHFLDTPRDAPEYPDLRGAVLEWLKLSKS